MREMKRKMLRVFFATEIVVFCCIHLFGSHGMQAFIKLKKENKLLQAEVTQLTKEVQHIADDIALFSSNTFYTEQIAREQLQMARKDELIYYIS